MSSALSSERVLVTGGTGFLGRHLALALRDDCEVVLTGRNQRQNAEAAAFTDCHVLPMDVGRIETVRDVFLEVAPAIVIHAAATKFVDLAEDQPLDCVDINVGGSQNVVRVALEHEVETLIGISTDKASPPVRNTYGLTKSLMERMFCTLDGRSKTRLACVRYGNVAWSTGSVLPTWKEMHQSGGVIESTGPDMRRFFFTVDEAVALVRTAIDRIDDVSGSVVAREMNAASIRDLLDTWVRHLGGRWEKIPGRPGDREDEYLIGETELPFTSTLAGTSIPHYVIRFERRASVPLAAPVSSATAARLSESEMLTLIQSEIEA